MRAALLRMGFEDVYHMTSAFHNPDDAQWWIRAANAKWNEKGTFTRGDWDKLLGHCEVCPSFLTDTMSSGLHFP
jgi:Sulfotransferase domain